MILEIKRLLGLLRKVAATFGRKILFRISINKP
jgi:hypothetical protein